MKTKREIHCTRRSLSIAVFGSFGICLMSMAADTDPSYRPLEVRHEDSADYRWRQKEVLANKLLDDMEDPATWRAGGYAKIELVSVRCRSGKHSLRMHAPVTSGKAGKRPGVGSFGEARAVRGFDKADWNRFNRISYWVYPVADDFGPVHILTKLQVRNSAVNSRTSSLAMNFTQLKNRQWNQVVWEISDLAREEVTGLELIFVMRGKPRVEGPDTLVFDFDQLELQRVAPDHVEGWDVAPGKIAFSHSGYMPGAVKRAFACDLQAGEFSVLERDTGAKVFGAEVKTVKTRLGTYQVMDFSDLDKQGEYFLRAGKRTSRTFRIGARLWEPSIRKVMNFFYCQRCGMEIPGIHSECHREFFCEHEGQRICVNGGWHDAADLTQKGENPDGVYAMLHLAERLQQQGGDPELVDRLIDEAVWGLDWLMKVSFHNGRRFTGGAMRWWMNGNVGDYDDVVRETSLSRQDFYLGSSAAIEAAAARVLRTRDAKHADKARHMAVEDWRFAMELMPDEPGLVSASAGAWASVELYKLTGKRQYAEKAAELGNVIARCQLRKRLAGCEKPITGAFMVDTKTNRWARNGHRGFQYQTMIALAGLCKELPDHPDWMQWYATLAIHSEFFQKATIDYTAPYYFLPNSIYHISEANRHVTEESITNGIPLGGGWYVRAFAIRGGENGNLAVLLSQAKMLSCAAQMRKNPELAELAQRQLYWCVGRNPFCQSLMIGEGYNFPPIFAYSGNWLVGAMPVGIKLRPPRDVPFLPTQTCWAYKEVWVHPAYLWLWVLEDLSGPSRIQGFRAQCSSPIVIHNIKTGREITLKYEPKRRFTVDVPQGRYQVRQGGVAASTAVVMPGATCEIDLRPGRPLDIQLARATQGGKVILTATVAGSGRHTLTLRTHNLTVPDAQKAIELTAGQPAVVTWSALVTRPDEPWVALVIPDDDFSKRVEQLGWASP